MLYFSGQHGAPTIDAIGHIGRNLKLHGGVDAVQATSRPDGIGNDLGIEAFPRDLLLSRGVLLDVARVVAGGAADPLPPGLEITAKHLEDAARAQGVRVSRGDSVLIRTGWGQYFAKDNARYLGEKSPGPGVDAGRWLVAQGVRLTGTDTATYEVRPAVNGKELFPVHMLMIADNGIYLVENANLEELGRGARPPLLPRGPAAPHPRSLGVAAPDARADAAPELRGGSARGGRRVGAAERARPGYNDLMTDAYREFEAESLFCGTCRRAMPVRKKLLLVLPTGNKYDYVCQQCGTPVGGKVDRDPTAFRETSRAARPPRRPRPPGAGPAPRPRRRG